MLFVCSDVGHTVRNLDTDRMMQNETWWLLMVTSIMQACKHLWCSVEHHSSNPIVITAFMHTIILASCCIARNIDGIMIYQPWIAICHDIAMAMLLHRACHDGRLTQLEHDKGGKGSSPFKLPF